jgi:integrase/recombinase XerD
LHNGSPIKPEAMDTMMKQLKKRVERLLKNDEITDPKEREILQYLIRTKKWNPYCIRHSAITLTQTHFQSLHSKRRYAGQ